MRAIDRKTGKQEALYFSTDPGYAAAHMTSPVFFAYFGFTGRSVRAEGARN